MLLETCSKSVPPKMIKKKSFRLIFNKMSGFDYEGVDLQGFSSAEILAEMKNEIDEAETEFFTRK